MTHSQFIPPQAAADSGGTPIGASGLREPAALSGHARGEGQGPVSASGEQLDFLALSREALTSARLADALERAGVVLASEDGAAPLASLAGGQTAPDRRERRTGATGLASELDTGKPSALSASGPTSGQLMAAAHTIASYLLTGSAEVLGSAAETLVPRGSQSLSIQLSYVTPEGGHAAVELVHPDLGDLAIEVSLSARSLSVLATAESERSAAAIRAGQDTLASKLATQGITLQSLTVVVVNRRPQNQARKKPKKPNDRKVEDGD